MDAAFQHKGRRGRTVLGETWGSIHMNIDILAKLHGLSSSTGTAMEQELVREMREGGLIASVR